MSEQNSSANSAAPNEWPEVDEKKFPNIHRIIRERKAVEAVKEHDVKN